MEQTNPITSYQYFIASPYFAGFDDLNSSSTKNFISIYAQLPESLKNFISSEETATIVTLAGLKYDLQEAQISQIAQLLRDLLVGNIFIKDFPSVLASKIQIEDTKASEIANYIVTQSFSPIAEDLKRVQRNKFPDKIQQLQKEARPATITQPGAKPAPQAAPTPAQRLNQPTARPDVKPLTPPTPQPVQPAPAPQPIKPAPEIKPAPSQAKPSISAEPKPAPVPSLEPKFPNISQPVRQSSLDQTRDRSGQIPSKPATPQQRPQFKIPDLGQPVTKEGTTTPKSSDIQKSFEDELQKVASVIDLRNKPKE